MGPTEPRGGREAGARLDSGAGRAGGTAGADGAAVGADGPAVRASLPRAATTLGRPAWRAGPQPAARPVASASRQSAHHAYGSRILLDTLTPFPAQKDCRAWPPRRHAADRKAPGAGYDAGAASGGRWSWTWGE